MLNIDDQNKLYCDNCNDGYYLHYNAMKCSYCTI